MNKRKKGSQLFKHIKISSLRHCTDGVPVCVTKKLCCNSVVMKKEPVNVNVVDEIANESTSGYADLLITLMSRFKTKPCMMVVDPSGELYQKHSKFLLKNNIKINVINFQEDCAQNDLNLFEPVLSRIEELKKPIVAFSGGYVVAFKKYETLAEANKAKEARVEILRKEIEQYIQDIVEVLLPSTDEFTYEHDVNTRKLLHNITITIIQNIVHNEQHVESLSLDNICKLFLGASSDAGSTELFRFFTESFYSISSKELAKKFFDLPSKIKESYVSRISSFIYTQENKKESLSKFSLCDFDKAPCVVFLAVSPSVVASTYLKLFLLHAYRSLSDLAQRNEQNFVTSTQCLLRPCYFVLTKFGDYQEIPRFSDMLSLSKLKQIFFICFFSSLSQLNAVQTCLDANMFLKHAMTIFIKNNDFDVLTFFSKLFLSQNADRDQSMITARDIKIPHKNKCVTYVFVDGYSLSRFKQVTPRFLKHLSASEDNVTKGSLSNIHDKNINYAETQDECFAKTLSRSVETAESIFEEATLLDPCSVVDGYNDINNEVQFETLISKINDLLTDVKIIFASSVIHKCL
ncbi:MAG: hypothetical protein LBU04_06555 [Christensenellaceae bacterium]|jgi:hypothetical protein|nr:hypothetical protein [Christensenellaceae bacterium]